MSETKRVTQHRAKVFLSNDLAAEFTVFDHHSSQVPGFAWDAFVSGYRRAHGSEPASTLLEYVTERATWAWDTTYTNGTVIIGDAEGPLALESAADDATGCRIVFWDEGNCYDTGLRVWEPEARMLAGMLAEQQQREQQD